MGQPFHKEAQLGLALLTREHVAKLVAKNQAELIRTSGLLSSNAGGPGSTSHTGYGMTTVNQPRVVSTAATVESHNGVDRMYT